ncbi:MAG TPA: cyclohexanecarboxylate-CoA ligase, partial [Acidimicrobiales bacterium]|nr:cyclohexanecarboxylate-CoA ligase [Acidimicrobiales bacterium]
PDRERGGRVCAVVVTAEGQEALTFEQMVAALKDAQLMTQKIPEQLEVVADLPRNQTLGKILKYQLRDTYAAKPWPA